MLVLTRLIGEKLVIGNEVIIEVLAITGDTVKLGISAPRETSVHRYEVFAEIQAANQAASQTASGPALPNLIETLTTRLRAREEAEEKD